MKTDKLVKKLAKKIATFRSPEYEVLFLNSESILKIAIQEYGYNRIQQLRIGELIEGVEKHIPKDIIKSKKIILSREL
jgi:hypothetical protein